jgi:UDP-glucose 4-epimerase
LELVRAAEEAIGKPVNHEIVDRRPGDAVEVYADPALANRVLRWRAERTVLDMCRDHWNWQSRHPFGFSDEHS